MSSVDPLADLGRVAPEGLDHLFAHGDTDAGPLEDEQAEEESIDTGSAATAGLTLAQTAAILGFDQRSVRRLIKERKICGRRQGADRNWVVDIECVQTWLQKLGLAQGDQTAAMDNERHQLAVSSNTDENFSTRTLWHKLDMTGQQLRAATYRIGYLESQVDLYRQQAALLPSCQAEAARTTAAELEVENFKRRLDEAATEIERLRRPWWQRWFAKADQQPEPR